MLLVEVCLGVVTRAEAIHEYELDLLDQQQVFSQGESRTKSISLSVSLSPSLMSYSWIVFTLDPYFWRVYLIWSAMRSRKVFPSLTSSKLFAFSRPIDVPKPPFSLKTAVCESNFCARIRICHSVNAIFTG